MNLLLRLYPSRWRERYGEEFEALLAASGTNAWVLIDVVRGAVDARATERGGMDVKRLLPWAILAACDALIGWMNFHATDDVQAVAAALMLAGFGFGLYRPGRAWLYAVILFLAIPVSGAYADALNYHPDVAKPAPLYESIVALIPALIGACMGAGARWVAHRSRV